MSACKTNSHGRHRKVLSSWHFATCFYWFKHNIIPLLTTLHQQRHENHNSAALFHLGLRKNISSNKKLVKHFAESSHRTTLRLLLLAKVLAVYCWEYQTEPSDQPVIPVLYFVLRTVWRLSEFSAERANI